MVLLPKNAMNKTLPLEKKKKQQQQQPIGKKNKKIQNKTSQQQKTSKQIWPLCHGKSDDI